MDYSRSIMEILESKLSPTPVSDGKIRIGGESASGTNSDIDAAIAESGASGLGCGITRREAMRVVVGRRKYGK